MKKSSLLKRHTRLFLVIFSSTLFALGIILGALMNQVAEENPWQNLVRKDLEAIKTAIEEGHPGMVDPENPGFKKFLDIYYKNSLAKVPIVNSMEGHEALLNYFTAMFNEGHLSIVPNYSKLMVSWPEFVVGYRNHSIIVVDVHDEKNLKLPQKGAKLIECDDIPVEKAIQERVFPYFGAYSDYLSAAPYLLVNEGNPFIKPIQKCTFEFDGKRTTLDLNWKSIKLSDLSKYLSKARAKQDTDFSIQEMPDEGVWVSIPTFKTATPEKQKKLNDIISFLPKYRDKAFIVLDLRGNTGGSGLYVESLIKNLWGEKYIEWLQENRPDYTEWRVSPLSEKLLQDALQNLATIGGDSDAEKEVKTTLKRLKEASRQGKKLLRDKKVTSEIKTKPDSIVKAKVFVLTDSYCGSACMRFLDLMIEQPDIIHIGQETSIDNNYTNGAIVPLPSGLDNVVIATKVMRNLPHKNYEAYSPKYAFKGDISDNPSVEKWVINLFKSLQEKKNNSTKK